MYFAIHPRLLNGTGVYSHAASIRGNTVPLYVFMSTHTYVCTRRNAEHYAAGVSEVADYIAAASHSSRATHAQTVSGALLCDSVAFVLARAGSGERCWRCSSLPQLFSALFRFVGQPVSRVCANESHAIFHGPVVCAVKT